MVVLDIQLDNFYAFKNFHMNLTYPKKIVDSCIEDEHLADRPNFRYKKLNIIMGPNASGKTTLGHIIKKIFNFLDRKNYDFITRVISDQTKPAVFCLDLASTNHIFYRVSCTITPCENGKYVAENIKLAIQKEKIWRNDSYQSCVKRIESKPYTPAQNYMDELEQMGSLDWMFEYPQDISRVLFFPKNDALFLPVLSHILKALDPAIESVEQSRDAENAYVIRLANRTVILQDGEQFDTDLLSSGTKAGVEVASVVSALMQKQCSFYYCDEKFPYIHSDIEKALLSLMIDCIDSDSQLFFTTHNTDILDMNLPKHAFTFLRKNPDDLSCPITCIEASSLLKRSTDSLRNAVENDVFSSAPAVDLIYEIDDLRPRG